MGRISPRQALEDNLRPADLQLRIYRLLENEEIQTRGALVTSFRALVGTIPDDEDVLVIVNDVFYGLVRESAQCPPGMLKKATLKSLLRQSIVASCTALDAYLPALLREHLPTVIAARGRDFYPQDQELQAFFADLSFSLDETLRLTLDPEAPLYIANKIMGLVRYQYLSSKKGVHMVGSLLAIDKPWDQISARLQREKKDLVRVVDETASRRNDIVHRADRAQGKETEEIQDISYAAALHAIDTIRHVCLTLDELVNERMKQFNS